MNEFIAYRVTVGPGVELEPAPMGKSPDGTVAQEHQRKLSLKPFRR